MHVFVTGPPGSGKSTVVNKTIELISDRIAARDRAGFIVAGFITYKGVDGDPNIYIESASEPLKRYAFAQSGPGGASGFRADVLENEGAALLEDAPEADLICMDELGFMEDAAPAFKKRVMACLDGSVPIIGALREKRRGNEISWHLPIKAHPSVTVLRVDECNRDGLPSRIVNIIFGINGYAGF